MNWSASRPRYAAYVRMKPRAKIPPGSLARSSFSIASRNPTLIFVVAAISSREMPRSSRSRRRFSPKEATNGLHLRWARRSACPNSLTDRIPKYSKRVTYLFSTRLETANPDDGPGSPGMGAWLPIHALDGLKRRLQWFTNGIEFPERLAWLRT